MSRPTPPDPLVIAYLAIGAIMAWNEASDEMCEAAADAYSGQLGYISEVISCAEELDKLYAEYAVLLGVFVYDIVEPYGQLRGEALLRNLPLPVPRAFVQAHIAQDRIERGVPS